MLCTWLCAVVASGGHAPHTFDQAGQAIGQLLGARRALLKFGAVAQTCGAYWLHVELTALECEAYCSSTCRFVQMTYCRCAVLVSTALKVLSLVAVCNPTAICSSGVMAVRCGNVC